MMKRALKMRKERDRGSKKKGSQERTRRWKRLERG